MADAAYNKLKEMLADGTLAWEGGAVKVLAIDDAGTYVFDADHDFLDDLGANELAGTGYARVTLVNPLVSAIDLANDLVRLLADPFTWTGIDAGTIQAVVVFRDTGSAATSPLISYHDTGFPKVTNGGDLTVNWAGAGDDEVIHVT